MTLAVEMRAASKHFLPGRHLFRRGAVVRAVDRVSFALPPGRVLGVAGESGSGKSTLANLLVGLETPSHGDITIAGHRMTRRPDAALRRGVQMVFQDPFGSIDPRFTIGRTVEEPLLIHRLGDAAERRRRAEEALEQAELRPAAAFRDLYPHELSGGQRQRVAIARAIVLRPKLLVADEPVSMLDVSVRAGILRLLRRLVDEGAMAMVFITHDLSIVGSLCDELAVMYRGRFVEVGPALDVLRRPLHPYTRALVAAVPVPDPAVTPAELPAKLLAGGAPTASGCRFAPRCSLAIAACETTDPELSEILPAHRAACLRAGETAGARP
ncbi:MAG: ABC transporter ATP-binding protein [Acidisphaera sp.]|nr:ABC transporter ATP-binding protein [Acidisphaera sp.]